MEGSWEWAILKVGIVGFLVAILVIKWGPYSYYYYNNNNNNDNNNNNSSSSNSNNNNLREGEEEEEKKRVPKGGKGWPFMGETLDFIASGYTSRPLSFMDSRKSRYGKVFKTHLLGKPVIVSTDPEVNKVVLTNNGDTFIPSYPKTINELFGESSLLKMNGKQHKRVHASLSRFFKSPHLKLLITKHIESTICLSLSTWSKRSYPFVYIQDETKQITFEILVKVLMSVEAGEEMEKLKREYKEFIKGLICLPIKLPGTQLYKSLKAKERLRKMIRKIIEDRKIKTGLANSSDLASDCDAVDVLLRENGGNDDVDQHLPLDSIAGNIIEMMVPGEDSVPMVMTLAVKYLSDNPIALERLTEENIKLKRQKEESGDSYEWTDYMSLTFTQYVISETLRMANIINAVWRQATKDIEIKGYLIPKGWTIMASFTSIHMDEQHYPNPYLFDPSRWQEKGVVGSSSSNIFTPFGGGQRLCPGLELARLEISIFLHHFVTTYRWVAGKDEIVYFPTVRMKRRLPVSLTLCSTHGAGV